MTNPYTVGLDLVRQHPGTRRQLALAKCILSLYDPIHAFSIIEIFGPLDGRYKAVALAMVDEYASHGDTPELREAGEWVHQNIPELLELSEAIIEARQEVRRKREREEEERPLTRTADTSSSVPSYLDRLRSHA